MNKRIVFGALLATVVFLVPGVSHARWMNPNTGRFWTMDSYEGNKENPPTLHKYVYAHNNPVNRIDPSGHESISTVMVDVGIVSVLQTIGAVAPGQIALKKTALIVHGDPDKALGLFEMAAETHKREVQSRTFWQTPVDAATDIKVTKATTVGQFIGQLQGKSVVYVAYFGHSGPKALYFGMQNAPDTNLSNEGGDNDTPVSKIPANVFARNAQIRLFGCSAGMGGGPIAQSVASHIKRSVWAYTNPGGSLFTQDLQLGHGQRAVTQADITGGNNIPYNISKDTWLVPANGKPTMTEFKP